MPIRLQPGDGKVSGPGEWVWVLFEEYRGGPSRRAMLVWSPNNDDMALLHVVRNAQDWDRGTVHAWNGDITFPTLTGSVQMKSWHGYVRDGLLVSALGPS